MREIRLGMTRTYYVPATGGFLMIDGGPEKSWDAFVKKADKKQMNLRDIKYFFLTHHHHDHTGFLARLLEINPDITLIVNRESIRYLANGTFCMDFAATSRLMRIMLGGKTAKAQPKFKPVNIDDHRHIIIDSDSDSILRHIGVAGKIVLTPGHTPDSMSIILDDGEAAVGDTLMNSGFLLSPGYRPVLVQSMIQLINSWEKLIDSGAELLFPGHGGPIEAARVQRKIVKFRRMAREFDSKNDRGGKS